ncbi:DUF6875 domain-containing protein [Streptomyces anulatus]|uniref:DUF6875 domain-containing protein n=1 Tax=Streptomyces anulatus TaxID=1892 RepID=UPI002150ED55|nr:hypothetical protein [Streptomyces anulatus]WSU32338.1 hypothetical protein OG391_29785 [Streptomyces anulatus]WSW86252.1 hypothetical protein OG536_30055 [Streptomyces anulatus]
MSTDMLAIDVGRALDEVDEWLTGYITQPHVEIGRSGAVCPFVAPARRADAVETAVRLVGPAASLSLLKEVIRCGLEEFEQFPWRVANPSLRSLLLVLPDLPAEAFGRLDQAHAELKPEAVHRGLMIGQFHAACEEPAARNPAFLVSRSPVPLVAVRAMAVHDILFLGDRPDWFAEYHRRFGEKYRNRSGGLGELLTGLYQKALALHGPGTPHQAGGDAE